MVGVRRRRADVGPAGGARRLPTVAPGPRRVRRRPDGGRRGLDPDRRSRWPRYVRADELHQAFNFDGCSPPWSAPRFAEVINESTALDDVDAEPTWVLSNHDVSGTSTRYGGGAVGLARARAATLVMLALPGLGVPLPGRGARPRAGRRRPARPGRTRPGSAPASPAGTAAGCRCRGRATRRRTGSGRARPALDPAAGRLGATSPSRPRRPTRPRPWRSTAEALAAVAGSTPTRDEWRGGGRRRRARRTTRRR